MPSPLSLVVVDAHLLGVVLGNVRVAEFLRHGWRLCVAVERCDVRDGKRVGLFKGSISECAKSRKGDKDCGIVRERESRGKVDTVSHQIIAGYQPVPSPDPFSIASLLIR